MVLSAKRIAEVSRKIFNQLPMDNVKTGNKILNKQLKGQTVASWHYKPFHLTLDKGDEYHELMNEDRLMKLDRLKRRGKGPPKKGQGKRATKKK